MLERTFKRGEDEGSFKKEVSDLLDHKHKSNSKKNNVLVTIGLLVLTFVSLAQTVQSASILNKVDEIKSSGTSSSALPSSLEDLPDMVGGC